MNAALKKIHVNITVYLLIKYVYLYLQLAYKSVQALRATFDVISLYRFMELDENRWLK